MKLLLTGSTGFVGRNFLLAVLSKAKYEQIILPVRSLEKLRSQFVGDGFDEIPACIVPVVGSAHDWKLHAGPIDHVVHCAGTLFGRTREEYFTVNVEGTLSLLKSLKSPLKVILISSQAAAGPCGSAQDSKSELDQDEPITWYGKSKLEMERRVATEFSHLSYLILRPSIVLGPRDSASLPLFKMAKGPVHFKPGFKTKFYSFISVSDLSEAIQSALGLEDWDTLSQRHFFVASDSVISDRDLLEGTAAVCKSRGVLVKIPQPLLKVVSRVVDSVPQLRRQIPTLTADRAREIWPDRWVVSTESFRKSFAWKSKDTLRTTLQATHDWYTKTGQLN